MLEGGHEGRHARIFLRRLARKPVDHVPEDAEAVLRAPFEETHVLERGHSLPHEAQDRRAEALDPRLDAVNARLTEKPYPGPSEGSPWSRRRGSSRSRDPGVTAERRAGTARR